MRYRVSANRTSSSIGRSREPVGGPLVSMLLRVRVEGSFSRSEILRMLEDPGPTSASCNSGEVGVTTFMFDMGMLWLFPRGLTWP